MCADICCLLYFNVTFPFQKVLFSWTATVRFKCHTELHVNVLESFFELLQHLSAGTEDTGDDKDPDALQDPVYHINIQQYLTEFLQSFSQQPYFHAFLQHLNKQEKQVLESIGVRT
ncbi:hypothetical protein Cfor_01764 [Coptotermes formosanus]|jgi:hypothetical protein|uniref:Uncharacterized protein n=1 Tax=Coptotermes formosanus TaxID=36987 RepID=A0A6L2PYN2_COPFO|nr:hypothetical protein Cfor_01764 [Coptotermes formosanus]